MSNAEQMRAQLEQLRAELTARRERITAHGRDGVPADLEEQATARENDDVVNSLGVQIDGELRQISAALARLERGDFGRCARCGEDIEPARLEALPYAEHCIRCAE